MTYNPGFTDVTAPISIAANGIASGQCVSLGGAATYTFQLTGTWVGGIQVQVTRDGTNWVNLGNGQIYNVSTSGTATAPTTNGTYMANVTGFLGARVISTTYTSGTITGSAALSQNVGIVSMAVGPSVTGSVSTIPNNGQLAYTLTTAASTNAAIIRSAAGSFLGVVVSNVTASPIYVKFYAKATAPTVGTDNPVIIIPVLAGETLIRDFGPMGMKFSPGLAIAVTGAAAPLDTTNAAAGALIMTSHF